MSDHPPTELPTADDGPPEPTYTVWLLDVEPPVADRYAGWLGTAFRVRFEPDASEAVESVADDPDVALLDREPRELSGDDLLAAVRSGDLDCRVVVVTRVEPDDDGSHVGVDSWLQKPVSREELRDTVRRLATLSSYTETVDEYYTVAAETASLETARDDDELRANEEYCRLRRRLRDLGEQADETVALVTDGCELRSVFKELA